MHRKKAEKKKWEKKIAGVESKWKDSFWRITGAGTKNQRDPFEMAVGCHGIMRIFSARTDDGRRYILDRSRADETCVVHCLDGNFTMPDLSIVFQEET